MSARFAASIEALHRHVEIKLASSSDERQAIFALRHQCYLRESAIVARDDGRLYDQFDEPGRSLLYGVWSGDRLIGSIRLQILRRPVSESPSCLAFPDIFHPLLAQGMTILDPTRFVLDHNASRELPGLAYLALRVPFMAAHAYAVGIAVAAVRSEHMAFYRRFLHYRAVAAPRPYLGLTKPLGLMMVDYPVQRPDVLGRCPFLAAKPLEMERLFPIMAAVEAA